MQDERLGGGGGGGGEEGLLPQSSHLPVIVVFIN